MRKRNFGGGEQMFNRNKFRAKVVEQGLTLEEVAKRIGINPSTLDRKMSGISDFSRKEIQILRKELSMTAAECDEIFFAEELT